jgi:hypothetical protein
MNTKYIDGLSDEEIRVAKGLSKAEFYDDPRLSFLTPKEEDEKEREEMEKYFSQGVGGRKIA